MKEDAAAAAGIRVLPGMLHRASLGYQGSSLDSVVLHVTRLLPGVSQPIHQQTHLHQGSVLLLGPISSGKTTILRDLVASLTLQHQVVLVDFMAELHASAFHPARTIVPTEPLDRVPFVQKVIQEQSLEVAGTDHLFL
ncbi:unnamed protein product [Symbiodinium pilosum]|uniref:Uncharacterized protein n=1 Tax=Symbiodinium pilosum TaxID=2952 RepID=A0A812LM03_SYMPI|nr:unnamed protein product [Symbiodinium pilosum]